MTPPPTVVRNIGGRHYRPLWLHDGRNIIHRLGTKLSAWARSLKKYSCVNGMDGQGQPNAVSLDRHVHPPGHDDKGNVGAAKTLEQQSRTIKSQQQPHDVSKGGGGYSSWIESETASAAMAVADSTTFVPPSDAELLQQQQLQGMVGGGGGAVAIKPSVLHDRSTSAASSDYDGRMIS